MTDDRPPGAPQDREPPRRAGESPGEEIVERVAWVSAPPGGVAAVPLYVRETAADRELRASIEANLRAMGAGRPSARPAPPALAEGARGAGRLWFEYHQAYLQDPEQIPEWSEEITTGVVEPLAGGGAIIFSGVYSGPVPYTFALHREAPAVRMEEWEDVAEVPVRAPAGILQLCGFAGGSLDERNLAFDGPGAYMVRVSSRGRDLEYDQAVELAHEVLHLDLWPAPDRPEARVHQAVSERIMRRRDGSRVGGPPRP